MSTLKKACLAPAADAVSTNFSPGAATPFRGSALCASGIPSSAVNGSNGNSSEGQHIINETERAEAVAVMDAQVCSSSSPVSAVLLN